MLRWGRGEREGLQGSTERGNEIKVILGVRFVCVSKSEAALGQVERG